MQVLDAIRQRRSIRAFRPDPIPRETLEAILDVAQRAPSGTNTQPWQVHLCTGAVQRAISEAVLARVRAGAASGYAESGYYPAAWNDIHNARRRALGWALYGLLGIAKGDRAAAARQAERNFLFFDAPVGVFVTIDAYLGQGNWADVGMYIQTLMLAAKGFGVDSCAQAAWVPYQDTVLAELGVPSGQRLVSGICLGYGRDDAVENTLVSAREPFGEVARFHGFD